MEHLARYAMKQMATMLFYQVEIAELAMPTYVVLALVQVNIVPLAILLSTESVLLQVVFAHAKQDTFRIRKNFVRHAIILASHAAMPIHAILANLTLLPIESQLP